MKHIWLLMLAVLLAGCAQQTENIKIGGAFALSGDAASWGTEEQRAVTLAFDEANAQGGIAGQLLELIAEDTHGDSALTLTAIQKLIEVDQVSVIIGPTWGDSFGHIVAPIGEEKHIIQISPSAALEAVENETTNYSYYFSTYYPQAPEIRTQINFLKQRQAKNIVSIRDADSFNVQFNNLFVKQARANNLTVAQVFDIPIDTVDYRTILLKTKQHNPDAVVVNFFNVEEIGRFMRQTTELGMDTIVVSSTSTQTSKLVEEYGEYAEQKVFYSFPWTDTQAFRDFESKYEARYGSKPASPAAATAYDAARVVIASLSTGARSGEQIRGALHTVEMPGVIVPTLRFTGLGQIADAPYVMKTVQDGEFIVVN